MYFEAPQRRNILVSIKPQAMKKFTGTILLTAALLTHVAITVATEESYIFTSADVTFPAGSGTASVNTTQLNGGNNSASPVAAESVIKSSGFYTVEEQLVP